MIVQMVLLLVFEHWSPGHTLYISPGPTEYQQMREAIVKAELSYGLGGKVFLSPSESLADHYMKHMKKNELQSPPGQLAAGMPFFQAKPLIEVSNVFKALKMMPKGAVLHLHNTAAVSSTWVIRNLTYRPEARLCSVDERHYFTVRPLSHCPVNQTRNINDMRKEWADGEESFDRWLEAIINMKLKPSTILRHQGSASIDDLWRDFETCFEAMKGFLQYKPFFEAYHQQLLHEFFQDNVIYIELRVSLSRLFDANGKEYEPLEVAYLLHRIVAEFRIQNPTFQGVKLILAKHKSMNDDELNSSLKVYDSLRSTMPGFVVGFDLVGQEDANRSLKTFAAALLRPPLPRYFFHAGETVGYYTEADQNLIDAILLDTRRIGHGYSLLKHPILWHAVRRKQIVLEVCPISNQVLGLVNDLRNHPAGFYVAQNIPITIAPDDPGFWDAKGVSYDYYFAFMAIAPSTGLGFLKQLVWDSIKYSAISDGERQNITQTLEKQWDVFVRGIGKEHDV
ncbi:adenosine deaminase 2-like [Anopheles bellator]|uniref:adenosine deaminase 2-like n=1 Tax=Anopheles bellator TaxID=139047 RepID=UPI00264934F7|nr:adenosine deaminase 2-like [Anopheles bellator]